MTLQYQQDYILFNSTQPWYRLQLSGNGKMKTFEEKFIDALWVVVNIIDILQ